MLYISWIRGPHKAGTGTHRDAESQPTMTLDILPRRVPKIGYAGCGFGTGG